MSRAHRLGGRPEQPHWLQRRRRDKQISTFSDFCHKKGELWKTRTPPVGGSGSRCWSENKHGATADKQLCQHRCVNPNLQEVAGEERRDGQVNWREAEGVFAERPARVTLSARVAFTPLSGIAQPLVGRKMASIVLGAWQLSPRWALQSLRTAAPDEARHC